MRESVGVCCWSSSLLITQNSTELSLSAMQSTSVAKLTQKPAVWDVSAGISGKPRAPLQVLPGLFAVALRIGLSAAPVNIPQLALQQKVDQIE